MPYRPAHPCRYPGCPALTNQPYCSKHAAQHKDMRLSAARRGYDADWRAFRIEHLLMEPLCRTCGRPATEVDHVVPLSRGGARLDHRNGQSQCESCHRRKTREEALGKR